MTLQTNSHPWRIMAVVFGGVLLYSFGIQKLFSPLGDAWAQAMDVRQTTVVGVVADAHTLTHLRQLARAVSCKSLIPVEAEALAAKS